MENIDIQKLLIQRDETRDALLLIWGRLSSHLELADVAQFEGLAREYDLLTKIHLQLVETGRVPASLLSYLEEIRARQESRLNAVYASTKALTPLDDSNADLAFREGARMAIANPPSSTLPASDEVF